MGMNTSFLLVAPCVDSAGSPTTQTIGPLMYDGAIGRYNTQQVTPDTNPLAIALPGSPCTQFYVKNTSPAAVLTLTWTKAAGGTGVQTLMPGGMMLSCEPAGGAGGITALQVQSDIANATFEWFASA